MQHDPKDVNRERFYAFERVARARFEPADPDDRPLIQLIDLALRAFRTVGIPPHPLVFSDAHPDGILAGSCTLCEGSCENDDGSASSILMFRIGLPQGRRRPWVVLHECAHALAFSDGHGPVFAALCLRLWCEFGDWPADALRALAEEHGIL